jgi:hypothetical protein
LTLRLAAPVVRRRSSERIIGQTYTNEPTRRTPPAHADLNRGPRARLLKSGASLRREFSLHRHAALLRKAPGAQPTADGRWS